MSFPPRHPYSAALVETVTWILQQDAGKRPYTTDVLRRVEELIAEADAAAAAAPPSKAGVGIPPGSVVVEMEMAPLAGGRV